MKLRIDFVTNSSSSSFLINRASLSALEFQEILNWFYDCSKNIDGWKIEITDYAIFGFTAINNHNSIDQLIDHLNLKTKIQFD